jgi:hypothetical protein
MQTPESEQTDCKNLDRIFSPTFFTPVFLINLPIRLLARFSVIRRTADLILALVRELFFLLALGALGRSALGALDSFILGSFGGFKLGGFGSSTIMGGFATSIMYI